MRCITKCTLIVFVYNVISHAKTLAHFMLYICMMKMQHWPSKNGAVVSHTADICAYNTVSCQLLHLHCIDVWSWAELDVLVIQILNGRCSFWNKKSDVMLNAWSVPFSHYANCCLLTLLRNYCTKLLQVFMHWWKGFISLHWLILLSWTSKS